MRLLRIVFSLAVLSFFTACNDNKTETKSENSITDSLRNTKPDTTSKETVGSGSQTIKAKYTEFVFGDASHFIFTDESGKTYDFAEIEDNDLELARELPQNEVNESNQGWGPNKAMIGKWFNITYKMKNQPLYPEGPLGDVLVIETAKPVE